MTSIEAPQLCRVSLLVGKGKLRDFSLPAGFGLDTVIEDLVRLLVGDGLLPEKPHTYTLAWVDGTPLNCGATLDECGVHDGDTLCLLPVESAQRFGEVVEEVSTAIARTALATLPGVDIATWRAVALGLGLAMTTLVEMLLGRWWWHHPTPTPAIISWVVTVLAVWAAKRRKTVGFGWCAVLTASAAAGLSIPGPPNPYHLVALASAAMVALGVLSFLTGRYVTASAATAVTGLAGTVCALIRASGWDVTSPRVAVAVLLCVLIGVTWAPNLGILASGIPGPWIHSITNKGMFADAPESIHPPAPGRQEPPVVPVQVTPTPSVEQITAWTKRANQVTTGILLGCGLVAIAAAWFASAPRTWPYLTYVAMVCWVVGVRSRAYVDRWCVVILATSAPLAAAAAIAHQADPTTASTLVCAGLIAGLGGLCALMTVGLANIKISAPINRVIEISEYVPCLILAGPWALALLGVWPVLRNLVHGP
jgi:type VII secretion integral membrane protein EccD